MRKIIPDALPQCLNDFEIRNKSTKGNWTKDFYSWSASRETKVKLIRGRYSILPKCMSIKAVSNGQFLIIVPSPIFNRVGQRIQIYRITKRHFRLGLDLVILCFEETHIKTNERYKHNLLVTNNPLQARQNFTRIFCVCWYCLLILSLSSHILYCFVRIQYECFDLAKTILLDVRLKDAAGGQVCSSSSENLSCMK